MILADAKIAEDGEWHADRLKIQLKDLLSLDIDIELTGFSTCEVDNIIIDDGTETDLLAGDGGPNLEPDRVVTEKDYVWILGVHRVICGNSLEPDVLMRLVGNDKVQMVVTDTPYNVKIQGHARGRSKKCHREFAMASGEMSDPEFVDFLIKAMLNAIRFSTDGSIHYWFIDWRHLPQLLQAALPQYSEWKNLLVWRKANAGQGSFYRSHHELIPVFTLLVREHDGVQHRVTVTPEGFLWGDRTYASLSAVAKAITGTNWNGRRFFGLPLDGRES